MEQTNTTEQAIDEIQWNPKQDKLDEAFGIYLGGTPDDDEFSDWLEFKQAINQQLIKARIDELNRSTGFMLASKHIRNYIVQRTAEIQKQSSSQEAK